VPVAVSFKSRKQKFNEKQDKEYYTTLFFLSLVILASGLHAAAAAETRDKDKIES
jgi:hypothetical protein